MTAPNYESKWWGLIYDQMMAELQDVLDANRRFYETNLRGVTGPVLECACGTGLILLPLLALGHDMYGFDISRAMLATLAAKAARQGAAGIEERISVQDLESFRYDRQFAAILIPTNAFVMLPTQEAQIRALNIIAAHLAPGGRLLLDLRLAGARDLADAAGGITGHWYTWTHPETGRPIRQRVDGQLDFGRQLVLDRCYIEYEGETADFPMTARWIFRDEFALLLRLAGFARWACYGTPEGAPLELGPEDRQSYWVAEKG
jgi:SAM-dependent methyltransferase